MFHHLLYPSTLKGKILHSSLILYLCTSLIGCATPQQPTVKPPTAVARAMETRSFSKDMKTVLKASINALQDMDYTIDVLNSDIGLITASRTTEKGQAPLSADNSSNNNQLSGLGKLLPIVFIAGAAIILFNLIFGGDDDDDDGDKRRDRDGPTIHLDSGGSNSDSSPVGPRIFRYKVTINLNDLNDMLSCANCNRAYVIRDNIPLMFLPNDWDIIKLSYHKLDGNAISDTMIKPSLSTKRGTNSGTFCYLMKASSAQTLKSILVPYNGRRSMDVLLRESFSRFHPYLTIKVLAREERFRYSIRKDLNLKGQKDIT